jgi:hypothetical protein
VADARDLHPVEHLLTAGGDHVLLGLPDVVDLRGAGRTR